MRAEHLLPLSTPAVEAIRAQQQHVHQSCPDGSDWLFPSRSDQRLPVPYDTFRKAFAEWQHHIGLHDETGCATSVTIHGLRHTLGTRMINSGVPEHVIPRLLGHASPMKMATYAHMHDTTIRAEFKRYCQTRVDVEGHLLGFDPQAVTADAEWVKHRLSRAADTLPNGYCGRPPQQDCPHPNACLTCPDFQTTAEFLPVHQQQAELTQELFDAAQSAGRQRQANNHREVLISLDKDHQLPAGAAPGGNRQCLTESKGSAKRRRPVTRPPCVAPRPPYSSWPGAVRQSPFVASPRPRESGSPVRGAVYDAAERAEARLGYPVNAVVRPLER